MRQGLDGGTCRGNGEGKREGDKVEGEGEKRAIRRELERGGEKGKGGGRKKKIRGRELRRKRRAG